MLIFHLCHNSHNLWLIKLPDSWKKNLLKSNQPINARLSTAVPTLNISTYIINSSYSLCKGKFTGRCTPKPVEVSTEGCFISAKFGSEEQCFNSKMYHLHFTEVEQRVISSIRNGSRLTIVYWSQYLRHLYF